MTRLIGPDSDTRCLQWRTAFSSRRRRVQRQGVVLLVVLTLLALFLVIGTTFLLVASSYRRAAQTQAREEWHSMPPQRLLDEAMYQLVRGTRDPNSALGYPIGAVGKSESLLADLYGYDGWLAYAAIESVQGNNQIRLHVPVPELNPSTPFPHNSPASIFTQGDWVLWRDIRDRNRAYYAQALPTPPPASTVQAPFIFGYYNGQYLTIVDVLPNPLFPNNPPPLALRYNTLPIVRYKLQTSNSPPPAYFSDLPVHNGGIYAGQYVFAEIDVTWPNNSYSSPSLESIVGLLPNSIVTVLVNGRPFTGKEGDPNHPDEQYDFPDNNNLFLAHSDPSKALPSVQRSLPSVDSDHDGVLDSVWVDLGMPVITGRDGRQVKALFAIRCIDLDGRLNVNFAGNRGHISLPNTFAIVDGGTANRYRPTRPVPVSPPTPSVPDLTFGDPIPSPAFGQGVGWGTADINLWDLLANTVQVALPGLTTKQVEAVAAAWYSQILDNRYGTQGRPGEVGDEINTSPVAWLKFPIYRTARSLIDFHAAIRYGIDPRGMPISEPPYALYPGTLPAAETPYELDADALRGQEPGAKDHLFSLSELESLLRYFDWDASNIPSRLRRVLFDSNSDGVPESLPLGESLPFRSSITTESWDLPALKFRAERGTSGEPRQSPLELLEQRIRNVLGSVPPAIIEDMVNRRVVAPDFVFGMAYDLNRPLPEWPSNTSDPNDPLVQQYYLARQEMAQQLYMLMLMLVDIPVTVGNQQGEEARTRIAQWAVNVVDFRDGDAIMTPFEFDIEPFDGWGVDNNFQSTAENNPPPPNPQPGQRRLVWGCERPELLITETLAWHDVRVERQGMNYQQTYRPRGYCFVELYNPWASPALGSDLNPWGFAPPAGVRLNQTTPNGEPVWRVEFEINSAYPGNQRIVYPAPPGGSAPQPWGATYYSDLVPQPLFVVPGQYCVIGSAGWLVDPSGPMSFNPDIDGDGNADYVSTLGLPNPSTVPPAPNYTQVRRVQISRTAAGMQLVRVDGFTGFPKPVTAIPVNRYLDGTGNPQWRSLNISEPVNAYPLLQVVEPMEQRYATPGSTPFDDGEHIQMGNLTPPDNSYASVKLQRLANMNLPFHPVTNPYIDVDHFENVNLTRINGASNDPPSDVPVRAYERRNTLWNHDNPQPSTAAQPMLAGTHYFQELIHTTLGYLNSTMGTPETNPLPNSLRPSWLPPDYFVGGPAQGTFPLLTWLNRPFRNQFELLDVPAVKSVELLHDFEPPNTYSGMRTHLLPLFDYRATGGQVVNSVPTSQFYHIFHFTRARSPFLGTETFFSNDPRDIFPRREPGKININTIPNQWVYLGLWNGAEVPPTQAGNLNSSWIPLFDTEFRPDRAVSANPYRPARLGDDITNDPLLWMFAQSNLNPRGMKPWPTGNGFEYMDGDVHTYFRIHGLNRIGSEITTTSNVYAVWITLGFFDLDPNTGQVIGEHRSETGEQKRHRAFYVIDRSVPVAFEPGVNHNVDRAVLLRRFIE